MRIRWADARPLLRILFLAVSIVLLSRLRQCGGLMLVRAIRRRREYAVRLALGARSSVLIKEAISEGMLLSVAGGLLGLALAAMALRFALHFLPESMPRNRCYLDRCERGCLALLLSLATGSRLQPRAGFRGTADKSDAELERRGERRHGRGES